jgi:hypothetical protein
LRELHSFSAAKAIPPTMQNGGTPFAAVLQFVTHELREHARQRLIANRIYCPVHWPSGAGSSDAAKSLSNTLLTLVSDQRYGIEDIKRIVSTLQKL